MNQVEARSLAIGDLRVGDAVWFDVTLSADLVDAFARLTGDRSPIHVSDGAAREAGFASRIAHGMLMASFLSTMVGMFLPGARPTLASQKTDFVEYVPVGATVAVSARLTQVSAAASAVVLSYTVCHAGLLAVRGQVTARVRER